MNRTIKEATVKRYHFDNRDQLHTHLVDFISAENFARRPKTINGLTPYEHPETVVQVEPLADGCAPTCRQLRNRASTVSSLVLRIVAASRSSQAPSGPRAMDSRSRQTLSAQVRASSGIKSVALHPIETFMQRAASVKMGGERTFAAVGTKVHYLGRRLQTLLQSGPTPCPRDAFGAKARSADEE